MPTTIKNYIDDFFKLESSAGILLMIMALAAIVIANSPLDTIYNQFLNTPVEVRIGSLNIAKPLLLWINDGLMAVFFFLVGLELKRELVEGELSNPKNVILPGIGALGGIAVPALIYVALNYQDHVALSGWAIPAATDIAFALGILTLVGSNVPISVKIFLTSLAIFDDIGAIIIIALFYTDNISINALIVTSVCIGILFFMNKKGMMSTSLYVFVGVIMWIATLKSGVHATLAGVILAMFIPIKDKDNPDHSPLKEMEHNLHSAVAFFILPIFAFANSGISFNNVGFEQIFHPVPLGIMAGLFVGKQLGIFSVCWLAVKLKLVSLPDNFNYRILYGVSILCGVGFTMSLFVGSLAFEESQGGFVFDERLGIILGSLFSGVLGFIALKWALKTNK